jgi:hypothetical protein
MTKPNDAVLDALDALYDARPSDFVALRKKLAGELKSAGDREASAIVAAARRPTATAWAMNHVMRNHPDVVARFTAAVDALRGLQRNMLGVGSAFKTSGSTDRAALDEAIGELLGLARAALEREDVAWNPATQRRIATSLRTFPMANAEDRERFLKGRLEKDLDTADDDALLQTTFGLADDEIAELPRRDHSPRPARAESANTRETKSREDEARIKERDRKADELDRQADRLEARAQEAEASAARARALADAARRDARNARAAKVTS